MTKDKLIFLLWLVSFFFYGCQKQSGAEVTSSGDSCQCKIQVYAGHSKEAPQQLVNMMRETNASDNNELRFAVFSLTYPSFVDEIIKAKERGVKVEGIIDPSQAKGEAMSNQLNRLLKAGIPLKQGDKNGLMHLKLLITKTGYISGSFNWTKSAQTRNDEVIEVGRNCESVRSQYEAIWQEIYNRNKFIEEESNEQFK